MTRPPTGKPARIPPSEAYIAMMEVLSDGAWHDGLRVCRVGERTVPPGRASRVGASRRTESTDLEDVIESGRKTVARRALADIIKRDRLETDVGGPLTRDHWAGVKPWRIRDPLANTLSVSDVAEELDLPVNVVYTWIKNEYIPVTRSPTSGSIRLSPTDMAIARKVREVWPGPRTINWPVDPRTLWQSGDSPKAMTCPHCGEPITVVVGKG